MRCFVAIELGAAARSALLRYMIGLRRRAGVRWCSEEQLHITLKFLGEILDADVPRVCEIVGDEARSVARFNIRLAGLGCFPGMHRPNVLWCGAHESSDGCVKWLRAADARLADLGVPVESRPLHLHVTLGRSKSHEGEASIRAVLAEGAAPPEGEFPVERFTIFESRLNRAGAEYVRVFEAPIGV